MATFDFIAISEHRVLNARAVEERAVAALFVDDAASLRTAVDGKVRAGHERIVGHGKLRLCRSSSDDDGLARGQGNPLPRHWPTLDFEKNSHSGLSPLSRANRQE